MGSNLSQVVDRNLSIIRQVPIFQDLPDDVIERLLETSRIRKHRKGVQLLAEGESGESLYLIISGRVKIFVSDENGNEMILFVESAGGYIGEISLLDDSPRIASAVTMEATEVISISKQSFKALVKENPDIAFNIIATYSKKLRRSTNVIRSLALRNVYQRLVLKLLELSEEENGVKVITVKYSYLELGKMIGASREMVGKVMTELFQGGYLEERDKKLIVLKNFPRDW